MWNVHIRKEETGSRHREGLSERNVKMNTRITKLAAIIAAAALAGVMLTACSGGNAEETTAETTTAAEVVTESETESETDAAEPETEAAEPETEAEVTEAETETEAEVTESEESAEDTDAAEDDTAANPLMPLVDAAMSVGEWPWLEEVTDAQIISDFFLMDTSKYEQSVFMQCPMSATMCEIIIVKSDDVDSAKADLEARQKKAQDTDAFYPADVERAGASIVGTEGSYAYFIMADSASDVEDALVEAIKAI